MVATDPAQEQGIRVRISKSGQITLPASIREDLGVGPGDYVAIEVRPSGTVQIRRMQTAHDLSGKFPLPEGETRSVAEILREMDATPMVRTQYQEGILRRD